MKSLKIIVVAILVLGLLLAFGACGKKTTVKDGVLTWATNAQFPPYEYYEGDNVVGIDAEIIALIAEKLGMKAQVEDMEFDSIIPACRAAKWTSAWRAMTVTGRAQAGRQLHLPVWRPANKVHHREGRFPRRRSG